MSDILILSLSLQCGSLNIGHPDTVDWPIQQTPINEE